MLMNPALGFRIRSRKGFQMEFLLSYSSSVRSFFARRIANRKKKPAAPNNTARRTRTIPAAIQIPNSSPLPFLKVGGHPRLRGSLLPQLLQVFRGAALQRSKLS